MFDGIAAGYDRLNRWMSLGQDRRWRRALVRALALSPGSRQEDRGTGLQAFVPERHWLDVATGTGEVALALAAACPDCTVVGVDASPGMLQIGHDKLAAAGLASRVELVPGDARALPFPDGSFDGACVAFGIRNIPDRPLALQELVRVVRPGGIVAVLELTEPRHGPLATLARLHVHVVVPRLGAWLSGDPAYAYLPKSVAAFPDPGTFAGLMRAAGLADVETTPLTFGVCHLFIGTVPHEGMKEELMP